MIEFRFYWNTGYEIVWETMVANVPNTVFVNGTHAGVVLLGMPWLCAEMWDSKNSEEEMNPMGYILFFVFGCGIYMELYMAYWVDISQKISHISIGIVYINIPYYVDISNS